MRRGRAPNERRHVGTELGDVHLPRIEVANGQKEHSIDLAHLTRNPSVIATTHPPKNAVLGHPGERLFITTSLEQRPGHHAPEPDTGRHGQPLRVRRPENESHPENRLIGSRHLCEEGYRFRENRVLVTSIG